MQITPIGGIVLAGGASRRMGQDKALLCHNGKTMLEGAVEALRTITGRIVIVASRVDLYRVSGADTVPDLYPGEGPVGGILTGLIALGAGCHVVIACDMPLASVSVIQLLVDAAQADPHCNAIVPELAGELEPLCAVYRDTAIPILDSFMKSGRRSAREALRQLTIKRIDEAELRLLDPNLSTFTNVNTPEDLASLDT